MPGPKADIYPFGHSRRTIRADLVRSMRPQILAAGIASEGELDEVDHAVREHLSDPGTLMLPNLLFLAWGANRTARTLLARASGPRETTEGDARARDRVYLA